MKKFTLFTLIIGFFSIISCGDDDKNTEATFGTVELNFTNTIDNAPIELNNTSYINGSAESYTISELKYIVSNIVLISDDGSEFVYPVAESYFVVNEEIETSKKITLTDVPSGTYTKIQYGIGVDQSNYPLNDVNDFIPTADENGMLWSWSAGYKFLKFEGTYTPEGGSPADFIIHVGSHGATLDNYKELTLNLSDALQIKETSSSEIMINADVAKIFDSANTHSLTVKSDIQVDPVNAPKIAENVQTMFTISNVSN
ncbi:hypothetical protein GCM10022393_05650 [Aquimarina addita]|uniref:Copper-binding protein MbnP-like domain-containing protein n=1 Tax=Aquimarina addita TaxID=870485 RepID=A0ABP7XA98_9FLAO